jgi:AraC family transcriptional activator of pobA
MDDILIIENFSQFNTLRGYETLHPLANIVDFSKSKPIQNARVHIDTYSVALKEGVCGELKYGCNYYDYQEGTLVFMAPGQVVGINNDVENFHPRGTGLFFHPDLIHGTSLGRNIKEYTFFSYESNEALHVSEREKQIILEGMKKIEFELNQNIDKHSKKLIVKNIELLLDYCMRFYDRQFITRSHVNKDILVRFENLLDNYLKSDITKTLGLPTVKYCADQLHLSANYFGDLIKKETGKSALEYIQLKLIEIAKERIFDKRKSVSEIAYELGFKHPQHFSRMFKNETGYTPIEYRLMN